MSCAGRHPATTFVMETSTHSPWVSRLLESLGHPVIVTNSRKLRAIAQSQTKNDQADARMLARLGLADPALLSPVKHRSESTKCAPRAHPPDILMSPGCVGMAHEHISHSVLRRLNA